MRILGLISGTSHDGIDSAVVEFRRHEAGLEAFVVTHGSTPYTSELRDRLVRALPPRNTTFEEVAQLDTLIGEAFARAAVAAIADAGPVDLIVSHGQTVYHWVEGPRVLGTLQIGQPGWIAEATGTPILSDVRIRDIAAGGQGAPLASTIDELILAGRATGGRPVAALNLGGISNVTVVGADLPRAWDIGPANALIDAVVRERGLHAAGYDESGAIAASGRIDEELLAVLLDEPYYRLPAPKSTGKELFHLDYVHAALGRLGREVDDADLLATLAALTIRTVADALAPLDPAEVFVSGGGVHNRVVTDGIARSLPGARIGRTDELGLGADEKEAVLMALIGWLSWHGVPGTTPSATGASGGRLLGTLTPGAEPLRLPEPCPRPAFLRMAPPQARAREHG
ncbi:anhydro-N-acetylmuramic acid kinase [Microbacterium lushaniae]|uniref:Anhydro-N-acetylmuramic acid kinase n=1 Tax=Microbacterium lushaniae TaxID=2614639 RepID=A0A5J6L0E6_9MICO|nr:anhydro-N-acetylmuramic acid kinase [Microbacterium lushaniae]QEW01945.1 anhydro-N-acetylmuramic acid kinase [Microbacterium lushaniae]